MTEPAPKRGPGRPKKVPVTRILTYAEQVKANKLLLAFHKATTTKDGPEARRILDDLVAILESAME